MAKDREVLIKAAAYMQRHGHARGQLENTKGAVCLAGAINKVLTGDPQSWPPRTDRLLKRIARYLGFKVGYDDYYPAITWNNQNGRTKRQVVAALRATAKQLPVN